MIAVTGATGQLGRLVIQALLHTHAAGQIVAAVRDPGKAADLAALGVQVRTADYDRPETLITAFDGVSRVLLISSNVLGQRTRQHQAAIAAARITGVKRLAYTSVLHADTSRLGLAAEHRETEALILASGLPYAILRNGWYTENYAASIPAALQHGALLGSAGSGRISSAARMDYAAAAAQVLTGEQSDNQILELAGDTSYTLAEFAAELARQSGKPVVYQDLPPAEYEAILKQAGLPPELAHLLADSDAAAAHGALFDDGRTLARLLGRATTPYSESIAAALP